MTDSSTGTADASNAAAGGKSFTVIVGVDSSDSAEHAFDWYIKYLHRPENKVIVVNCMEIITVHHYSTVVVAPEWLNAEFERQKKHGSLLELKYRKKCEAKQVDSEYRLLMGKPGEAICHLANEQPVQMVVVGTRGHGKIRRTILGSVSDYVIHHAHCPVVVVHKETPL